jgi:guanine deaminase
VLTIFRARICNFPNPDSAQDFPDGFIAVSETGKIVDFGKWNKNKEKQYLQKQFKTIDYSDYIILPAFIDMHLHLPQFHLRGHYGVSLLDWLKAYIIPAENTLTVPEKTESFIRAFFQEMWRSGTTTALIFSSNSMHFTDQAFKVARQIGFRAIIGKVMTDNKFSSMKMPVEKTGKSVRESIALFNKWHGCNDLLYYAFSPRFGPAATEKLLRHVGDFAYKNNAYIHTHLAETTGEIELIKNLFPRYKTYTEFYYKNNILGPKTIVAHAIYLKESEYKLLAKTHTKVAHCPSSNFFLHSGLANTQKMQDYGIEMGLGSDVGAGPSFSMFTIMRDAYYVRNIPPAQAFYYATLGAARALDLDDRIGSFNKGKDADFVVVKYPYWCNKDVSRTRLLSQLMFRGDDHLTIETYTRGKKVYQKTG